MKFRLLFLLSALLPLSSSCKSTNSNLKETEIPADRAMKADVGMGWNSDKEGFLGICLKGTTKELGAQASSIRFTGSMSSEELFTMLGFSMSAKAMSGLYNGSAAANFSAENSPQ